MESIAGDTQYTHLASTCVRMGVHSRICTAPWLNIRLPQGPPIPFPDRHPGERKTCSQRKTWTLVLTGVLPNRRAIPESLNCWMDKPNVQAGSVDIIWQQKGIKNQHALQCGLTWKMFKSVKEVSCRRLFIAWYHLFFWERVSPHSSGWPQTWALPPSPKCWEHKYAAHPGSVWDHFYEMSKLSKFMKTESSLVALGSGRRQRQGVRGEWCLSWGNKKFCDAFRFLLWRLGQAALELEIFLPQPPHSVIIGKCHHACGLRVHFESDGMF